MEHNIFQLCIEGFVSGLYSQWSIRQLYCVVDLAVGGCQGRDEWSFPSDVGYCFKLMSGRFVVNT